MQKRPTLCFRGACRQWKWQYGACRQWKRQQYVNFGLALWHCPHACTRTCMSRSSLLGGCRRTHHRTPPGNQRGSPWQFHLNGVKQVESGIMWVWVSQRRQGSWQCSICLHCTAAHLQLQQQYGTYTPCTHFQSSSGRRTAGRSRWGKSKGSHRQCSSHRRTPEGVVHVPGS